MSEQPYQNREIDQLFKAADERADSFHTTLMQRMDEFEENSIKQWTRIEEQTKKTNGSVANLKMWRAYITGAVAVIAFFLVSIVIPVVSSWIQIGKL